jgi:DNA-binding transcriptional ArsR family regulator
VATYQLRMHADDVARVRFAPSPLWETANAVRALVDPRQQRYHLPWLEQVRSRLDDIDIAPLLAIQPMQGYNPDLIAPLPRHPRVTVDEQIAQVRATPLEVVDEEITRSLQERADEPVPDLLRALARNPRKARERLANALEECWHQLVEPWWPRIRDLLTADIAHHSRLLAEGGLARLFPAIDNRITWTGADVRVDGGGRPGVHRRDTAGAGLLLQPSAFSWPILVVISDERYQPTIVYPARGVAELWQPRRDDTDAALGRLIGRTRAVLLGSVVEPATTTLLARRHELALGTVSEHLDTLVAAGLVQRTRTGRSVFYAVTALGEALLDGQS